MQILELGLGGLEDVGVLIPRTLEVIGVDGFALGDITFWGLLESGISFVVVDDWRGLCIIGHDDDLEDLEGIRCVRGGSGDTDVISGGHADQVALEAELPINFDLEDIDTLTDLDLGWATQVTIRELAVSPGQFVNVSKLAIVDGTIIQKGPHHAPCSAMGINDECQTSKLADGIDAAGADIPLSLFHQPDIKVAAATLGAVCAEVDICDPFCNLERVGGPDGAALVAGGDGGEDDFVGEDLGFYD